MFDIFRPSHSLRKEEPLCSMHLMNTVADLKGGGGARPSLFGPNLPFLNEKLRQKSVILKISHKRPPPPFFFLFRHPIESVSKFPLHQKDTVNPLKVHQSILSWPGADPGGTVLTPRTPFWGTPKLHKRRKKTSRACAQKRRVLVLNSYLDPPAFWNPVSAPELIIPCSSTYPCGPWV